MKQKGWAGDMSKGRGGSESEEGVGGERALKRKDYFAFRSGGNRRKVWPFKDFESMSLDKKALSRSH